MYILGLSSYYHDSAAALIKDGKILCAAEEERFSRIKHDNVFPFKSIKFCLSYKGISINDIKYVSYYEKPLLKFERVLETFVETFPRSFVPFIKGIPEWLDYKIKVGRTIAKDAGFRGKVFYIPHHLSHASVSFLTSPFKKAAILTVDGVGDLPTTGMWLGDGGEIKNLKMLNFPHSLGLFYSAVTSFLGFRVNNDEYKVMGLSAYGKPKYTEKLYRMFDLKEDGSFRLNMDYFSFRESFRMWSDKFEEELGKPRLYGQKVTARDRDLAASLQRVTEDIYFKMLNCLHSLTKSDNLCIGGGVALNSLANGKIFKNTKFKNVYIFGAAGDSGCAVGAALYVYKHILNKKTPPAASTLYLGGINNDSEIEKELKVAGVKYRRFQTEAEMIDYTVKLLLKNKIIGWYQGRMEFGPRALGNRSILANPMQRRMKDKVNKIKKREEFRPFAASVLQEKVHEFFEVPEKNYYSPFMNFCFIARPEKRRYIRAVVHADSTCRIQTVNKDNGVYYRLIKAFYKSAKIPCILNTSFNIGSEPIVENPKQAIADFINTTLDSLIIGDFVVER